MSDLLVPSAQRVGLALAGGLGAVVLAERRRLRDLASSVLFVRWRTWAITAPIFGAAVLWSSWGSLALVSHLVQAQALRQTLLVLTARTGDDDACGDGGEPVGARRRRGRIAS